MRYRDRESKLTFGGFSRKHVLLVLAEPQLVWCWGCARFVVWHGEMQANEESESCRTHPSPRTAWMVRSVAQVDSDERTIDLVKRNVAHARVQGGRDCCDVMLLARVEWGARIWCVSTEMCQHDKCEHYVFESLQFGHVNDSMNLCSLVTLLIGFQCWLEEPG